VAECSLEVSPLLLHYIALTPCSLTVSHAWTSVSVTLVLMMVSRTVHPPTGAAALIGVLTDRTSHLYILYPVGFGVVVMFFIAMVINNIKRQVWSYALVDGELNQAHYLLSLCGQYPAYWIRPKRAAAAAAAILRGRRYGATSSFFDSASRCEQCRWCRIRPVNTLWNSKHLVDPEDTAHQTAVAMYLL